MSALALLMLKKNLILDAEEKAHAKNDASKSWDIV